MQAVLDFVKVSLGVFANLIHDASHGIYDFIISHWPTISGYANYCWVNLNLAIDHIVNIAVNIIH